MIRALALFALTAWPVHAGPPTWRPNASQGFSQQDDHDKDHGHRGWDLDVDVAFSQASGTTVADKTGVHYLAPNGGLLGEENKVYPQWLWGTYPMYYFGSPVGITVTITNRGPREVAKIQVVSEVYDMKLDGSNGVVLMAPKTVDLKIKRGETKTIDDTFVAQQVAGAISGLDRLQIRVLHLNHEDNDSDKDDGTVPLHAPKALLVKNAIFCPPNFGSKN
jgi:hypothetical protein